MLAAEGTAFSHFPPVSSSPCPHPCPHAIRRVVSVPVADKSTTGIVALAWPNVLSPEAVAAPGGAVELSLLMLLTASRRDLALSIVSLMVSQKLKAHRTLCAQIAACALLSFNEELAFTPDPVRQFRRKSLQTATRPPYTPHGSLRTPPPPSASARAASGPRASPVRYRRGLRGV